MHLAANKGHLDVVKQLLAVGADVNAREEDHVRRNLKNYLFRNLS